MSRDKTFMGNYIFYLAEVVFSLADYALFFFLTCLSSFLATSMAAHWRALVVRPYSSQTPSMLHMYSHVANKEMRCSSVSNLI